MAVKKQWTMTVRNINDEQIRVLIKERGATSSDTWEYYTLHPSENSIVLEESDDPYATIITTTGYIKFLRKADETTPLPTADSQLYIDNITTGEVIFRGYLTKDHYESKLFDYLQEYTYNFHDLFGALDFDLDEYDLLPLAGASFYTQKTVAGWIGSAISQAGYSDGIEMLDFVQVSYYGYADGVSNTRVYVEGYNEQEFYDRDHRWYYMGPMETLGRHADIGSILVTSRTVEEKVEYTYNYKSANDVIETLLNKNLQIGIRGNTMYIRNKFFAGAVITLGIGAFQDLWRLPRDLPFHYSTIVGDTALTPVEDTVRRRDAMNATSVELFTHYAVYGIESKMGWIDPPGSDEYDQIMGARWQRAWQPSDRQGITLGSIFNRHTFRRRKIKEQGDDYTHFYEIDVTCHIPISGIVKDIVVHTTPTTQFPASRTLTSKSYIHRFDPMFPVNYEGRHLLMYSIKRNIIDDVATVRLRSIPSHEDTPVDIPSWY